MATSIVSQRNESVSKPSFPVVQFYKNFTVSAEQIFMKLELQQVAFVGTTVMFTPTMSVSSWWNGVYISVYFTELCAPISSQSD